MGRSYGYVYETLSERIQTAEAQLTDGLEKAVIQGKVLRVEVEKIHLVFVFMMQRIHRSMRIL